MQTHAFPPIVVAFLVLDQPRQRLSHWMQALAPLDDRRAPPLASVNGYYDPTRDQALLGVSYDELALGSERLAYVVDVALRAQIGMIQPAELSEADRRRFLSDRIARCTVTVAHQRSVLGALSELVRRVRDHRSPRSSSHDLPRTPKPPPAPVIPLLAKRGAPLEPELLVVQPRSTRDDLGRLRRAQMEELAKPERRLSRHVISRAPSPPPSTPPAAATDAPRVRASTAQMDPLDAQKLAAVDLPPVVPVLSETTRQHPLPPQARGSQEISIDPYAPSPAALPPGAIYARYLRSGRWVPVRIGALSLRGAALMAGALPRVDDRVDLAFAYTDLRAIVRGPVHKVSTREETSRRGAASFSVAFELDDRARRQLTALLQAARAANVTIKPPPPRGNRRYPVEWPVCLGTARGAIRAEALDVSREGMFVRQASALPLDASLSFSVMLDDRGSPVCGRSRVVRFLDETGARSCGLVPGYGLRIVEMDDGDRERWSGFLARVERRAERRVLIGASTGRLRELQGGLAAAGYAVAGAADPEALMQLASRDEHAADACLIDAAWQPPGRSATWSEALFPTRSVPCVAMRGDVRRAREAIDQVLSIV